MEDKDVHFESVPGLQPGALEQVLWFFFSISEPHFPPHPPFVKRGGSGMMSYSEGLMRIIVQCFAQC